MIKSQLEEAVKVLQKGGIVIYPTDTAFGIGCRLDSEKSVERLFYMRKRPTDKATPVLVNSVEMAQKYFLSPLPDNVRRLMKDYWPGALTIIYKCRTELIPSLVRGGGETVGLRMPNHEVLSELIKQLNIPILGPSANFHGKPTPFAYNELDPELVKLVDYVIEGKCYLKQASTVIDCTREPYKIIRQGAIVIEN